MEKRTLKSYIYSSEVRVLGIISNGLVGKSPKQVILKNVKQELTHLMRRVGLKADEANMLWFKYVQIYDSVSKKTFAELRRIDRNFGKTEQYEENLSRRRDSLYRAVRAYVYDEIEPLKNAVANRVEFREKHDELYGVSGLIQSNRDKSPFFLCSTHENPAQDHEDWEGKMYYDEDWEQYITDRATQKRVAAYIRNHSLNTVQWVTGEPVWLITRPNCKHYMISVSIDEALRSSVRSLLKKHGMYMKDEKQISPEQATYRKYYERLKVLEYLNKMSPSDELKKDIKKTRKLLITWRKKKQK